ncbi:MAG: hypothetical protein JRJ69_07795 [Deltaproteobacteria bacterium]|nr:hypothetical protein [Deltaproteobacteria bacterium]
MVMLLGVFKQALMITVFVFVMMLLVDFIDMASKGRMSGIIKGGQWRQYTLASSLYVHGMISFGAIVGGMIATSGDEAFVMLAQFPGTALALFVLLFVFGIVFAWISDRMIQMTGITPCESCFDAVCEECLPGTGIQEKISDIFRPANLIENYKSLSFTRFLLLMLIVPTYLGLETHYIYIPFTGHVVHYNNLLRTLS